jgi:hypothetical protein
MTDQLVLTDNAGLERVRIGEIEEVGSPATGKSGVGPGPAAEITAD